jgi:Diacylglycerol kinase accessory domain
VQETSTSSRKGAASAAHATTKAMNNYLGIGVDAKASICLANFRASGTIFSSCLPSWVQTSALTTDDLLTAWDIAVSTLVPLQPEHSFGSSGMGSPPPPLPDNGQGQEKDGDATHSVAHVSACQVALDFHSLRAGYPQWFQSQFGNKLWYTGMGAIDIIDHTCFDLPAKLQASQ